MLFFALSVRTSGLQIKPSIQGTSATFAGPLYIAMALCACNAHNTVYDVTTWSSVNLVNPVCFFAATYRKFQMRINILNVLVQGNAGLLIKRRVSNCSGDGSSSSTLFVTAVMGRPSTPGCLQIVPIIHAGLKSPASGKARA